VQFGRQTANLASVADVRRYCFNMAMLPAKRFVRALAVGLLVLVGAALAGPAPLGAAHVGTLAFQAPPPPPPDPIPIIEKERSANPGPGNNAAPQPRPRRHHG
jgi:hypothetical protein